jgi:hypothetical protein
MPRWRHSLFREIFRIYPDALADLRSASFFISTGDQFFYLPFPPSACFGIISADEDGVVCRRNLQKGANFVPIVINRADSGGTGSKKPDKGTSKAAASKKSQKVGTGDLSASQQKLLLIGLCVVIVAAVAFIGWWSFLRSTPDQIETRTTTRFQSEGLQNTRIPAPEAGPGVGPGTPGGTMQPGQTGGTPGTFGGLQGNNGAPPPGSDEGDADERD